MKVRTNVDCTHCGLPVPTGLIEPHRAEQFCCSGCAGAYELIHSGGLDSFYRISDSESAKRTLSGFSRSKSRFDEFDEAIFQAKYARTLSQLESEIELAIDGIHCGACVWLLEKLPTLLPGVVDATVNWAKRTIRIRWRTDEIPLSKIAATLKQLGYFPSQLQPNDRLDRWQIENRRHLIQIGIAAACAGNNMIISAALYFGMFSHMTAGMTQLMRIASCVVGLVALLWPGKTFLRSAWNALRTRTPHMDLPIALGLTVGTIAGLVNVIRGAGEIYFDSLSVLIFLLLIGRWIQFRQQSKAANAVEMLYRLTPQMTRKMVDGVPVDTLVDLVQVGDTLQIRAGDLFPVDGEIVEGVTRVDESILTGESRLLEKANGDLVSAGTANVSTVVTMQANAIGRETRLSKIVELVEQAALEKPKLVLWANKIGGYFVAVVVVLAFLTLAWWITIDVEVAIDRTIALLIVACPCALALATPLSIAVALGRAAKRKIMVKGGDVLQSLRQPGMMWLDKTGTLTEGNLKVSHWHGDTRWIATAAALENGSSHPIASAIVNHGFESRALYAGLKSNESAGLLWILEHSRTRVLNAKEFPGMGITGTIGGYDVLIGSKELLSKFEIGIESRHIRLANRTIEKGFSPCWVVINGSVVAIAAIGDSIRTEAHSAIEKLKQKGWRIGMLSGDHQQVVDRVAKRLGIESKLAIGGANPEEKLRVVNESSADGCVVMVGDGVNDSAALAAATVGIAVKNGAEASLAAAPVYLGEPGLNPILNLLSLSDATARTMRLNLGVSFAYNITFAALAIFGYINPLVAAILMPISSLTVVALSLGAGRTSSQPMYAQSKAHKGENR